MQNKRIISELKLHITHKETELSMVYTLATVSLLNATVQTKDLIEKKVLDFQMSLSKEECSMSELETEKRIYKKMHKMKPKSKFTYLDGGRERSKPSKSIRDFNSPVSPSQGSYQTGSSKKHHDLEVKLMGNYA